MHTHVTQCAKFFTLSFNFATFGVERAQESEWTVKLGVSRARDKLWSRLQPLRGRERGGLHRCGSLARQPGPVDFAGNEGDRRAVVDLVLRQPSTRS